MQDVNITAEAVEAFDRDLNANKQQPKKQQVFDSKNYLNVRLDPGQTRKELTIRLIPMSNGIPFVKVHTHNIPVNEKISKSGFKTYICLSKTDGIDREKYGNKCPLCELNHSEYEAFVNSEGDEKNKHKEESLKYRSRESVIIRCIERGKEDEGVKFWKFNLRSDGTDPYNQMMNLYTKRKEAGKKKGKDVNIFDIENGKDFNVVITEGNAAPLITDDDEYTPLTENVAQRDAWLGDSKTWQDVFAVKPYEYLEIVARGNVPWFDRESGKWIEKEYGNQTDAAPVVDYVESRVNNEQQASYDQPQANTSVISEDLPF